MALVQLLAVKVSFICLYYEVAEDLSRRARQLLHLAAFCVILVCGVFILVYGFARCIPFRRYWYDFLRDLNSYYMTDQTEIVGQSEAITVSPYTQSNSMPL